MLVIRCFSPRAWRSFRGATGSSPWRFAIKRSRIRRMPTPGRSCLKFSHPIRRIWWERKQLMGFASLREEPVDLAGMKREIIRLGSEDERMARVTAMLFGRQLAERSADEVADELGGLPDGIREEVVWAAFKGSDKPENITGLADLLIEEEAWGKLQRPEAAWLIQQAARDGRAAEFAGWAMSLPTRMEATGLFDAAVETYLADHPQAARAWLADLPPDVWRDRALAAYSKAALNVHSNTQASRWALNQIGDLHFKNEAEDWRAQWEKRKGWAGN